MDQELKDRVEKMQASIMRAAVEDRIKKAHSDMHEAIQHQHKMKGNPVSAEDYKPLKEYTTETVIGGNYPTYQGLGCDQSSVKAADPLEQFKRELEWKLSSKDVRIAQLELENSRLKEEILDLYRRLSKYVE